MRSPKVVAGLVCLILGIIQAPGLAAENAEVKWHTDLNKALEDARSLDRPVLVHFYGTFCPPCRRMDKEVLPSNEIRKMIEVGFVPVKLDIEKNKALVAKYKIETIPADMILSPDGRILNQTTGFQEKDKYLSTLARIESKYGEGRKLRIAKSQGNTSASLPTNSSRQPLPRLDREIDTTSGSTRPQEKLPPYPTDIDLTETQPNPKAEPLALDGFCPVTLWNTRNWKQGSKEFSLEHQGQVYYFVSEEQREAFRSDPLRFAPRLSGCDPVVLLESEIAIRGSTRFGAYYEGELYLFETTATRTKFRNNPERYSRVKHVVKPEEILRERA